MVNNLVIMIIAVIAAAAVMIFASGPISKFVEDHPTIKMLALSFLLLIGFTLVVKHYATSKPKAPLYFAMGFSVFVELLNLRLQGKKEEPIKFRSVYGTAAARG